MPVIRVTNVSNNTLSLGSAFGNLTPRDTRVSDVSVAEFEQLSEALVELQNKGLITWSVDTASESIEFLPKEASTTATQERLDIYVDATEGSDTNLGTKGNPLATLVEAERRIPDFVNHPVVIHVAPHDPTTSGYSRPEFRERVMRASIDVYAPDVNVLYEGVAQTGSSHAGLVAPAGLGVETYRGKTIEMTSGLQKGFRRTISTHTDTNIEPCILWQSGQIQPGDTFRIFEPVTVIDITSDPGNWTLTKGATQVLALGTNSNVDVELPGINFINFSLLGWKTIHVASVVGWFGCEWQGETAIFSGGQHRIGIDHQSYTTFSDEDERVNAGLRIEGVDFNAWVGWGIHAPGQYGVSFSGTQGVEGFGVVASGFVTKDGLARIRGGNIYTSGILVQGTSIDRETKLTLRGKYYLPDNRIRVTTTPDDQFTFYNLPGAIRVWGPNATLWADAITVTADIGAAVLVTRGQVDLLQEVSLAGPVGIKVQHGGRVSFMYAYVPGITATGNDIEVGNTPTVGTTANLTNLGDYLAEPDGSVIQRVS